MYSDWFIQSKRVDRIRQRIRQKKDYSTIYRQVILNLVFFARRQILTILPIRWVILINQARRIRQFRHFKSRLRTAFIIWAVLHFRHFCPSVPGLSEFTGFTSGNLMMSHSDDSCCWILSFLYRFKINPSIIRYLSGYCLKIQFLCFINGRSV